MTAPTLDHEQACWAEGCRYVAGVDEVGRGPLAGPVVAAAVILKPDGPEIDGVRDSKRLTARRRLEVAERIKTLALGWGIAAASVREIDRVNILRATAWAMRRAVARLPAEPERLLIDGSPLPELRARHEAIVRGDAVCQSIAAASVLAKCVRDRLMILLAHHYPEYQWERNKGYGTAAHLAAIEAHGLSPHHRRSFADFSQIEIF